MEKLRTCPFCGGAVKLEARVLISCYAIKCTRQECGADIFFYGAEINKEEMVKRFNRRAERSEE